MNNTKKSSSGTIIKFYKYPVSEYILMTTIWSILIFSIVFFIVKGIEANSITTPIFCAVVIVPFALYAIVHSFRQCVVVDLSQETMTVSNTGFRKTTIPLNEVAGIAVTILPDGCIMLTISDVNRNNYPLNIWSVKSPRGPQTWTESTYKRRKRYEDFAHQINTIIRERYPYKNPINYDESDE